VDGLAIILSGLVGLTVGSFLNVVIHRLPRGESVVSPGSRCPSCGTPIRWFQNVPLVSWLALRGRCAS
jgi:leader peptidase (prepilin peptidase)/N-methyltransferase